MHLSTNKITSFTRKTFDCKTCVRQGTNNKKVEALNSRKKHDSKRPTLPILFTCNDECTFKKIGGWRF